MTAKYKCINLKVLLITIVCTFSFISCEKKAEPNTEITIKDGLIFKQGDLKPYSGFIKDTLEGKIIEYQVVDGKKTGEFKTYFINGNLEMIGQIKDNVNQGKWIYYYPTGQVESEGTFKDDLPDGNWKWFYENGNLKEEGKYVMGNREGRWLMYNLDGTLKEERMLEKNQIIDRK